MTAKTQCRTGSRKRVRFEEDTETRQVKRRVLEMPLPKSSLMTAEEKMCYWMQHQDHRDTLEDVMTLMHDCHHESEATSKNGNDSSGSSSDDEEDPNKVSFAQYAEALALTFMLCDTPPIINTEHENDDDKDNKESDDAPTWNIRDSRSVGQLALWASHHTSTRGVESKILPGLFHERQLRRTRTIQGVLKTQKQLKTNQAAVEEATMTLGAVSRACSHSAKQFATALAVVDGTQALLEYQRLPKQLTQPEPTRACQQQQSSKQEEQALKQAPPGCPKQVNTATSSTDNKSTHHKALNLCRSTTNSLLSTATTLL